MRDRILRFEGAKNVRDLGGLATVSGAHTRRGVVYRADGLSRLTDADLDQFTRLGIRTVIDLRHEDERSREPDRLPDGGEIGVRVRGFTPQGSIELFHAVNEDGADGRRALEMMRDNYARIVLEHTAELRGIIDDLLAPGAAPHLLHCVSGKDRTGIAVAIILLAVHVARDDVVADYMLSDVEQQPVDVFGPRARADAIDVVMSARPEYIESALDSVEREFGTFERYLARGLELGPAERERLVELLVDSA